MRIIELKERQDIIEDQRLNDDYARFNAILTQLRARELPNDFVERMNSDVQELNATTLAGNALKKFIKQKQADLLKRLEKELKIVPKNRYRNLWLAVGMSAFGIPIGVAMGVSIGNMAMLATGLPIGMAIGIGIGVGLDKKAQEEGRQLDVEV